LPVAEPRKSSKDEMIKAVIRQIQCMPRQEGAKERGGLVQSPAGAHPQKVGLQAWYAPTPYLIKIAMTRDLKDGRTGGRAGGQKRCFFSRQQALS